ncbi:MAG: hypothetical protein AAF628_31900 [Planctomycetota bacterium]
MSSVQVSACNGDGVLGSAPASYPFPKTLLQFLLLPMLVHGGLSVDPTVSAQARVRRPAPRGG